MNRTLKHLPQQRPQSGFWRILVPENTFFVSRSLWNTKYFILLMQIPPAPLAYKGFHKSCSGKRSVWPYLIQYFKIIKAEQQRALISVIEIPEFYNISGFNFIRILNQKSNQSMNCIWFSFNTIVFPHKSDNDCLLWARCSARPVVARKLKLVWQSQWICASSCLKYGVVWIDLSYLIQMQNWTVETYVPYIFHPWTGHGACTNE